MADRGAGTGVIEVERIRAAIRLLYPDEMTPTAKRMLESICDEPMPYSKAFDQVLGSVKEAVPFPIEWEDE